MVIKLLIRLSVAALILICIGVSGCSEGSDRIYTPTASESNDQLALGLEPDYAVDGNPGDGAGYPIFDNGSQGDQYYDNWIVPGDPGTGDTTQPQDFRPDP